MIHVALRRSTIKFENVASNTQVSGTLQIDGDGHFEINGQPADGTTLSDSYGYVTNGMEGERVVFYRQHLRSH